MSNTATLWLIFSVGFGRVSTHKLLDFGWVLINSEPPPWPLEHFDGLPGVACA